MVVVDANAILRCLLKDQAEQFAKATAFFRRVQAGEILAYVSDAVLAECVYVLLKVYRVPRREIASGLASILSMRGLTAPDIQAQVAALRLFASESLDFVDALVLSIAERRGWAAFSFDRDVA
jgi:predicted nucleic-acid-binding protein